MTAKAHLDSAHVRRLLGQMIRIRLFEEKCAELYTQQKIRGFLHLYSGEEANAVGIMEALAPEDCIVATYREHGHALARGIAMGPLMAEMYGKASGTSLGRGGSMHVFDRATRFYGGNAIVGGGLPLAVGLALAEKMRGGRGVAVCLFGEGAVAEGEFHESLNLAALWKLPILFVCENNLYAMGSAIERTESETDIHRKAEAYRIESRRVDGMDVVAVEAATRAALEVLVAVGSEAPVGAVMARIEGHDTMATPAAEPAPQPMPGPAPAPVLPPVLATPPRPSPGRERLRISPAAARRALQLGVDARGLHGSGPQGAITVADVEAITANPPAAATPPAALTAPRRGFDPAAMRQAIAAAMARSKREIPHYYLSLPIDMGRAFEWITIENKNRDVERRLLPAALLLRATALALRQVPQLNGFWIDGAPKLSQAVHVGWAISLRGGGLMAPAVRDADKLSLDQAMAALRDLVTRARTARIRGSEMMDPTVTVTFS